MYAALVSAYAAVRFNDAYTLTNVLSWSGIRVRAPNKYLLHTLLAANVIDRAPWAERDPNVHHDVVQCRGKGSRRIALSFKVALHVVGDSETVVSTLLVTSPRGERSRPTAQALGQQCARRRTYLRTYVCTSCERTSVRRGGPYVVPTLYVVRRTSFVRRTLVSAYASLKRTETHA